jgi:Ca2+-binding EF-hand superfamily protein
LNVEHSKFADRMFALIDKDASGLIDFEEFVVATWNYCTMTKAALIKFAFGASPSSAAAATAAPLTAPPPRAELYDVDGSGSINQLELKDMFLEVCGEDFAQSERAQLLLEKVEGIAAAHHINDGEITVGVFADFIKQNAGLLTSVFHLQLQMQKQLGGLSFWKHMSTVREELVEAGKGDVSSMGDIMKLHNEREKGERKVKKMAKDSESRQATRRALLKKQQSFAKGAGNRIAVTSNANGQNPYMKRHRDRKLDAIDLLDSVAATIEDNEIVVPHEHYLKDVVLNNPARDLSLDAEMEKYLADQARTRGWQEEWDSTSTMKTTNAAGEELVKYKD